GTENNENGVTLFSSADVVFEYNTIENSGSTLARGLNYKERPIRAIVRYNYLAEGEFYMANQDAAGGLRGHDNALYGNIFDGISIHAVGHSDNDSFYNNTFVNGGGLAWIAEDAGTQLTGSNVYNNIVHNPSSIRECNSGAGCNVVIVDLSWASVS